MGPRSQSAAAPPAAPQPIRVPTMYDADVVADRRRQSDEEAASRRGRESTRLAPASAGGGVVPYTRTVLGG